MLLYQLIKGVFCYRKRNTFANKQLILLYLKFPQKGSFKLEEQTKNTGSVSKHVIVHALGLQRTHDNGLRDRRIWEEANTNTVA